MMHFSVSTKTAMGGDATDGNTNGFFFVLATTQVAFYTISFNAPRIVVSRLCDGA